MVLLKFSLIFYQFQLGIAYKSVSYKKSVHFKVKDTHREKAPSNKTPALTKSMNMDIWVVGTPNQLFRRGSYSETKFSKN